MLSCVPSPGAAYEQPHISDFEALHMWKIHVEHTQETSALWKDFIRKGTSINANAGKEAIIWVQKVDLEQNEMLRCEIQQGQYKPCTS